MVHRLLFTRKEDFRTHQTELASTLTTLLGLQGLRTLSPYYRYDLEGLDEKTFDSISKNLLSLVQRDMIVPALPACDFVLGVEMLSGQFDQRADSVKLCLQLLYPGLEVQVRCATFYCFEGSFTDRQKEQLKQYFINPVESREASPDLPEQLALKLDKPKYPALVPQFRTATDLDEVRKSYGLAMDKEDLLVVQRWFATQHRDPSLTELKVIDTYWSDHCRHTTFSTELDSVVIEENEIARVYEQYLSSRKELGTTKPVTLMDLATIAAKQLYKQGLLTRLDLSEEINACSVHIDVKTEQGTIPYLLQFKNETHNHPTEIEPFGGAATCIGGAIRDPLSGRAYVYQGMRISGSGDPRTPFSETLEGKLPQRTIALGSAHGFSSYGNQVGLATGMVEEIYHPRFVAKHMELGFVIGASPLQQVRRSSVEELDVVILVGGRTGRDGCGGATGSSKSHDSTSIETCGSEVQRGNAPEERKIQRLMRNGKASRMIKRCNDFGAGGVSVAIGELAKGVLIDLDAIPTKYEGLDGTERAISESQERMAMVVSPSDAETFIQYAHEENLEATVVGWVTAEPRLVMLHQGRKLVDIERSLLDSNGAAKHASVHIGKISRKAEEKREPFDEKRLKTLLGDLNVASKQALARRFDSTIGAGTLLLPYGGKTQSTPIQAMACLIPVLDGSTSTASIASWGYDPYEMESNAFEGAFKAVVHSLCKVVASGGDWDQTYLTFQEYFGKLGTDKSRWGLVVSALLGAYKAQLLFGKAAIGGKDSMSGSFGELDVPPTLVSFAVSVGDAKHIVSPEFKSPDSDLVLLQASNEQELPILLKRVSKLINEQKIRSCYALGYGGIAIAVVKMSLGNQIGCRLQTSLDLGEKRYGSFLVEVEKNSLQDGILIGHTTNKEVLDFGLFCIDCKTAKQLLETPLEAVYGRADEGEGERVPTLSYHERGQHTGKYPTVKPKVVIPVFAGTNCEYDVKRAWKACGAEPELLVINTLDAKAVHESVGRCEEALSQAQILFLPGGFSAADEPDGSGKFIAAFFRNEKLKHSITRLLGERDGLVGGICNGFQALVQLGLLPHGRIVPLKAEDPLLLENQRLGHISQLVRCRVSSVLSPWFGAYSVGDTFLLPISHGEGRFYAPPHVLQSLAKNGQIAAQYVNLQNEAVGFSSYNPNGSLYAVEALTSADGKVFGRMAHSERMCPSLYQNTPATADLGLFWGAVRYFS